MGRKGSFGQQSVEKDNTISKTRGRRARGADNRVSKGVDLLEHCARAAGTSRRRFRSRLRRSTGSACATACQGARHGISRGLHPPGRPGLLPHRRQRSKGRTCLALRRAHGHPIGRDRPYRGNERPARIFAQVRLTVGSAIASASLVDPLENVSENQPLQVRDLDSIVATNKTTKTFHVVFGTEVDQRAFIRDEYRITRAETKYFL